MHSNQRHVLRQTGYNYLIHTPHDYKDLSTWPLILFLHGAGEKGDNLELIKRTVLPKNLEKSVNFPFIVISPQCPRNLYWSAPLVIDVLNEAVSRYKIDEERIYLTGISMGGFGTWETAIIQPWRFAALAPICGGGDPEKVHLLKHIPIWVFHGALDNIVPLTRSLVMVEALKRAGGNVRFTIYPEAGHDSWTQTYDNTELYAWFLPTAGKKDLGI